MTKILVLSAHTAPVMNAPINHQVYCQRHGFNYVFDITPYPNRMAFDQKLNAINAHLPRADWLLWLDDDAYFMDQEKSLLDFIPDDPDVDMIICNSPINAKGEFSFVNSGVILLRNSPGARQLMKDITETDISKVRAWWDFAKYGLFTCGDQNSFTYQIVTQGLEGNRVSILPFGQMNARHYHFKNSHEDHFICHLCGVSDKDYTLKKMRKRFGLNEYMLRPDEASNLAPYKFSVFSGRSRPKNYIRRAKDFIKSRFFEK